MDIYSKGEGIKIPKCTTLPSHIRLTSHHLPPHTQLYTFPSHDEGNEKEERKEIYQWIDIYNSPSIIHSYNQMRNQKDISISISTLNPISSPRLISPLHTDGPRYRYILC
jgi:hypothetical protein